RWVLPLDLGRSVKAIRSLLLDIQPDLVHALRIPFEAVAAAKAVPDKVPLVVSIWGNDLTLWASSNGVIARQTKFVLSRADALLADCERDLRLAAQGFGFDDRKPTALFPGSGGVRAEVFNAGLAADELRRELRLDGAAEVALNPRGMRAYVANEV